MHHVAAAAAAAAADSAHLSRRDHKLPSNVGLGDHHLLRQATFSDGTYKQQPAAADTFSHSTM